MSPAFWKNWRRGKSSPQANWRSADADPDLVACRDMAAYTAPSVLIFVAFLAGFGLTTDFVRLHPAASLAAGTYLALALAARWRMTTLIFRDAPPASQHWLRHWRLTVGLGGAGWGCLVAFTIYSHRYADFRSFFMMLFIAAAAGTSTSSFAPDRPSARLASLGMLIPTMAVSASFGDPESWTFFAMCLAYCLHLSVVIQRNHKQYWRSVNGYRLLQQSAGEIETARLLAESANRAQDDLLGRMSDSFRHPLNGITGMLDLALDTSLSAEQREYLETARDSTRSLLVLIENLLDFSRIESGNMRFESVEFGLLPLLTETLNRFSRPCRDKGIELRRNFSSELPVSVVGDAIRLKQILVNLLDNAVRYTERGAVTLSASVSDSGAGSARILFSVHDTGAGIEASRQEQIFEPFATHAISSSNGAGLGLSVCRRLAELNGGRMWVESTRGVGADFRFTFQFQLPEHAPAESAQPVGAVTR